MENKMINEKEEEFRKTKETNIIIFNIPESGGDENNQRIQDQLKLRTVLKNKLSLNNEDVRLIRRLGDEPNKLKSRPLLMKFTTIEKKTGSTKTKKTNLSKRRNKREFCNLYIS